jgi:hypothetical protein
MAIRVKDVRVHPITGYMEVEVVAEKTAGRTTTTGPVRTYGIDAGVLQAAYSGDVKLWLAVVKGQHEDYTGLHNDLSDKLMAYKGMEL